MHKIYICAENYRKETHKTYIHVIYYFIYGFYMLLHVFYVDSILFLHVFYICLYVCYIVIKYILYVNKREDEKKNNE